MRRFIALALIVCALSTAVAADPQATLLGRSIEEVQKTQFFQFFNLSKANEFADPVHPGVKITTFGVQGRLKGDVNLLVGTKEGSDKIFVATLMLRRDFIDGPMSLRARRG